MAPGKDPTAETRAEAALQHVRAAALALPQGTEKLSHGAPSFFIGDKKCFTMLHDDHHGDGRLAIWCPAPDGAQAEMVDEDPERFFVPPYVGWRGWLGVRLDVRPDWDEVAAIVTDAYRCVAPKRLLAELDQQHRERPR
ncbi:MAG TPA: MmcQ/YjbR family DNA-binding protein [Ilumatobacteraceae bacterium]|nr:MmcQ/YjbR family DNA-binding protein [Ilumatobacteraceae bacterium]